MNYVQQISMDKALDTNVTEAFVEVTESLEDLNKRYADALVPMAGWLGLLAVLGIFGNLLVIVVFTISPEYKSTNFKVFVISLATVDLLTCVTLMPADIIKTRHYFHFENRAPCKVKCFFNLFGLIASALVLLLICVDRFRKVYMPLKHQIWPGLATRLVVVILFASFVLSLPGPFLCGISSANRTNIHGTNTTVFFCAAEEIYRDSVLRKAYKVGLTAALLGIAIAFIVMYSLILKTIIRHRRNISKGGSVRFKDNTQPQKSKWDSVKNLQLGDCIAVEDTTKCCAHNVNDVARIPMLTTGQNGRSHDSLKTVYTLKKSGSLRSNNQYSLRRNPIRRHSSSATSGRVPYKTFIWIILTLVFVVTYTVHAILSFTRTELYMLSPQTLLWFMFFFRIHFVNNVVNPVVYICLDKRFKVSCCHLVNLIKR